MQASSSFHRFLFRIMAVAGVALLPSRAAASQEFPGALQEAADMPCAPSCTVCHGKTPGDLASFTARALPRALIAQGVTAAAHDVSFIKNAYAKYKLDPANAAAVAALKEGRDPETAENLCGPTYGCGAHVAKKPPPADVAAPLWVVGIMLVGGLLRRRKPAAN